MTNSSLSIIADDRERNSGVIDALRGHPETQVVLRRLLIGDYLIDNRILIERKTPADFAQSIIDGRLFRQAGDMAKQKTRPVFIIEGTTSNLIDHQMSREAMQGALITISVFYGIPVLRSHDSQETARLMLYIGRQHNRLIAHSLARGGKRPRGVRRQQLYILQGLPGIGPVRAERLLIKFGNLQAVFNATLNELLQIENIGPIEAQKLCSIIRERLSSTPSPSNIRTPPASRAGGTE